MEHLGWYTRGYFPHADAADTIQNITFRLDDAVPAKVVEKWKIELAWRERLDANDPVNLELEARIAEYEDGGYGECWLGKPEIANLVEEALLYFDEERYKLLNWCVMPNHVHALLKQMEGHQLGRVMQSLKSFTARRANELLNRRGAFWQRDYFDRYIRNEEHLYRTRRYIENNPVKAGLVRRPEEWRWSSAWKGRDRK